MAAVKSARIEELLNKLPFLLVKLKMDGSLSPTVLSSLEETYKNVFAQLPKGANDKFDPAGWDGLPEAQQHALYQPLRQIRDALEHLAESDGPADHRSFMHKEYASNEIIVGLALLAVVTTVVLLAVIFLLWPAATPTPVPAPSSGAPTDPLVIPVTTPAAAAAPATATAGATPTTTTPAGTAQASTASYVRVPSESTVILMVMLMGALGGLLHLTSSLSRYVGERRLYKSWVIYYLLMPLQSATLALVLFLLLRVGALAPTTFSSADGQSLINVYALACLSGLFSRQALEMLAEVFNVVFRKVQAKDSYQEKQAP